MIKRLFITIFTVILAISVVYFGKLLDLAQVVSVDAHLYNPQIVVLDAGHGGFDGGAENKNLGIVEKDINLKITKKLQELLVSAGYRVIMTRTEDESTSNVDSSKIRSQKVSDIHNRLAIMTKYENAIVVSIHLNKFSEEYVHGAQVFYAPNSKGSDVLAQHIQDSFSSTIQKDNKRAIKPAGSSIYVLHKNHTNPAVMVESGFISNTEEGKLLLTDEYQNKIAITIFNGILEYFNSSKK